MKMISESFATVYHYLWTDSSLSAMTPETIIYMINWSFSIRILDEDMHNLNRYLIVLNFCGLPSNPLD